MEEQSEEQEILEDFSIVTITIDGEGEPEVDLGNVSPHAAITIFELVAETLKDLLMPPRVSYKNRYIVNYGYGYGFEETVFEDEEDDEDWPDLA